MTKRDTQIDKTPTRKQIARSKREREQLRMIYIGLGVVIALILIVLAYGLIQTFILEPNAPVAIVNGVQITTRDYQDRVRYERFMLEDQYQQILQQQAMLAQPGNEQLAQFLGQQYDQYAQQTLQQRRTVDSDTIEVMIDDKLVEAEANKRGIIIPEEEITEFINRFLAGRSGGLTSVAASETATARVVASATAALWTPTSTFTPSPTLTPTAEITQPTATPTNTSTPGPTPTLYVIPADTLTQQYKDWLNILTDKADIDETKYREFVRTVVLREKLRQELGKETPTRALQAHARHILVETEEEAGKVVERLKAGEDFAELAKELSLDITSGAKGGDLGFVPGGLFVKPVDEAIFSLPINQISRPIQSEFGWHVVEVLAREERELSPVDYSRSQRLAYTSWLDKTRADANIENLWSIDKAPKDTFFTPPDF